MLAMEYRGPYRVRVSQKPTPAIEHPHDARVNGSRVLHLEGCSDLRTVGLYPDDVDQAYRVQTWPGARG